MYAPMLHDLAYPLAVASLLLAAAVAPSAVHGQDFSLDPVAVSSVSRVEDPVSGAERVEVLMADLTQAEVDSFLRALEPRSPGASRQVREVEVFNVYGGDGEDVVHQEQEIQLRYQDGSRQDLRLRRGAGSRLLPPPRKVLEKKLSQPPRFAPVMSNRDLESVEVEIRREASAAYESTGYRSSWFGEG